ncbi:MAG: transporter [Proteobacteria bacterium]|nr:transporter [Pseudomonadota bacterium]
MFASFFPLSSFAAWLGAALSIPPNSPVKAHPNGSLWITIFIGAMVFSMLLGYALGWLANAAIARFLLRWPVKKLRAVYLQSAVPAHWLKDGASPSLDTQIQSLTRWEEQRKAGALRFIFKRGVLTWGSSMLLVMYVIPTLVKGQSFALSGALFNLALWTVAGTAFGAAIWLLSEYNYRKIKGAD